MLPPAPCQDFKWGFFDWEIARLTQPILVLIPLGSLYRCVGIVLFLSGAYNFLNFLVRENVIAFGLTRLWPLIMQNGKIGMI